MKGWTGTGDLEIDDAYRLVWGKAFLWHETPEASDRMPERVAGLDAAIKDLIRLCRDRVPA